MIGAAATWSQATSRRNSTRSAKRPPKSTSPSVGSARHICATPTHDADARSSPTTSHEKTTWFIEEASAQLPTEPRNQAYGDDAARAVAARGASDIEPFIAQRGVSVL